MLEKRSSKIILVLSIFIVCLFLTLPAHQANKWGLYSQDIKLQGVSGRYLHGQTRQLTVNKFILNNVSWDWQASSLLLGSLALEWKVDDRSIQGKGAAAQSIFGDASISNAKIKLNTEILNSYLPKGNTVSGDVDVNIDSLLFQQQLNSISANAKTNELSIRTLLGLIKIEHIKIEASGNDSDGFHIVITDFINIKSVNVVAEIKQNKVVLSGYLSTQSDLAKQLKPILPFIAKKQADKWLVTWQGKL